MTAYTGPIQPTKEEWEKWYHRMKDFMNPLQQRQLGIACNPKDEAMMKDMLEQLLEDETWAHEDVPPLIISNQMQIGEVQPITLTDMKIIQMREALGSSIGFGRFKGLALPSGMDGLNNPWRIPKGQRPKVITPDDPDRPLN